MKIGLFFRAGNPPPWQRDWHQFYQETLEQVKWAEELGFDAVATTEHHFSPDGYVPCPLTVEAAFAAVTSRIQICSWVILLPLYHPLRLAEEAALVDILSGGRLALGLGLGFRWDEYEAFGVNRRDASRIADEALEIIVRAFTEDDFSFKGQFFDLKNVTMTPKPYRKPRPPIWMGLPTTAAGIKRVAKWGLEGFAGTPSPALYQTYLTDCKELGTQPIASSQHSLFGHCALDAETAWQEGRQYAQWAWSWYRNWWWTYGETQRMAKPLRNDRFLFGDPTMWVDWIRDAMKVNPPVSHLFVGLQLPGMPHEMVMRSMELFARQVLPKVRDEEQVL